MAHDQFDNAARLETLGVGLHIERRRYNTQTVVEKLSVLLRSESVRDQCRTIAAHFRDSNPVDSICQLIESASPSAANPSFQRTAFGSR
jgi:rhamnosyltransferase subunit B